MSMEDGRVGGFVECGIATAEAESAIVGMGGAGIESQLRYIENYRTIRP